MSLTLRHFVALTRQLQFRLTADELADIVWLARFMPTCDHRELTGDRSDMPAESPLQSKVGEHSPSDEPTELSSSQESVDRSLTHTVVNDDPKKAEYALLRPSQPWTSPGQSAVRVPRAPGLEHSFKFANSLRPLRHVMPSRTAFTVDYTRTAHRCLLERIWEPVMVPEFQRSLSLALVVDGSSFMHLWQSLVGELHHLLSESGTFRSYRSWSSWRDAKGDYIVEGLRRQPRAARRDPREVVEPEPQVIMLVSDAVADQWYQPTWTKILACWGGRSHVVLLNPLDDSLWDRTRLGSALPVQVTSHSAFEVNARLTVDGTPQIPSTTANAPSIYLPVVSIDYASVFAWANTVMGRPGYSVHGRLLQCSDLPSASGHRLDPDRKDPVEKLRRFWRVASPIARRMLCLLSAAPAINLEVIRIMRSAFLPDCRLSHEAEVLYSGLLHPQPATDAGTIPFFEMPREARRLLQDGLPRTEMEYVFKKVWDYLEKNLNQPNAFRALLQNSTIEGVVGDAPFLKVSFEVASRLWPEKLKPAEYEQSNERSDPEDSTAAEVKITNAPEQLRVEPESTLSEPPNLYDAQIYCLMESSPAMQTLSQFCKTHPSASRWSDAAIEMVPLARLSQLTDHVLLSKSRHYDLLFDYLNKNGAFLSNELIATLQELGTYEPALIAPELSEDFFPNVWRELAWHKAPRDFPRVVGVPFAANTMILVYNKTLFSDPSMCRKFRAKYRSEIEVPKTWAAMYKLARFFSEGKRGIFGLIMQGRANDIYFEALNFIYGQGGAVVTTQNCWEPVTEKSVRIASKKTIAAFEGYRKFVLVSHPQFQEVGPDLQLELLMRGEGAMAIIWSDYACGLTRQAPDVFGFAPIPGPVSQMAGGMFLVNRQSTKKRLCAKFIEFLMRKDTQVSLARSGYCSPRRSVYADEAVRCLPYIPAVLESLERGISMVEGGPIAPFIIRTVEKALTMTIAAHESVKDILLQAQQEILESLHREGIQ